MGTGTNTAGPAQAGASIAQLIIGQEKQLLDNWLELQARSAGFRKDASSENRIKTQSQQFLKLFAEAASSGQFEDTESKYWEPLREFLAEISASRAKQGFSPSETALFIFSLKQPLFNLLRSQNGKDSEALVANIWSLTTVLDTLGLFVAEMYQKSREEVINRQQQEMLELSTPVVQLWEGVLALPLIGTLDSARTQVVMETLLQEIVNTGASIAIIDITGVPTVDTLVAQHLLKTIAAARLMGADCIISGIRPQIAQTIVHLGVELNDVITKATLADAFTIALTRLQFAVVRSPVRE